MYLIHGDFLRVAHLYVMESKAVRAELLDVFVVEFDTLTHDWGS